MKKIILHIGLPKTGTTAIQSAFFSVRHQILAQQRVLYPSAAECHTIPIRTIFTDQKSLSETNAEDGLHPEGKKLRSQFDAELSRDNWDVALISGEGISSLSAASLADLKNWLSAYSKSITVVLVLRDPVAHTVSSIQQIIKGGRTLEESYVKLHRIKWEQLFNRVGRVFGKNHIVYPFEDAVDAESGALAYFCKVIGLNDEVRKMVCAAPSRKNESMSFEAAKILSALNRIRLMEGKDDINNTRMGRERQIISRVRGSKFDVPESVKMRIYEETRRDASLAHKLYNIDRYMYTAEECINGSRIGGTPDICWDSIALIIRDLVDSTTRVRNKMEKHQ